MHSSVLRIDNYNGLGQVLELLYWEKFYQVYEEKVSAMAERK
jgi:hypothetical protein